MREGTYGSMRKNFLWGFPLPPFVYFSSGPPDQAGEAKAVKHSSRAIGMTCRLSRRQDNQTRATGRGTVTCQDEIGRADFLCQIVNRCAHPGPLQVLSVRRSRSGRKTLQHLEVLWYVIPRSPAP